MKNKPLERCRLNRKVALTMLLAVLTLSVCFTAVASTPSRLSYFSGVQHVGSIQQLTASVPVVLGASLHSNSTQPLSQPTRLGIYNFVNSNPGVHFRGICDRLGLSVGVVQYHLSVLERAGLITAYTDGQNKRYFEHNAFSKADMKLISLMRHETTAKILTTLAQNTSVLHKDIARSLGVSSQALSWQMNQLKKAGLISAEKVGVNVKYCLDDANARKLVLKLASG
jgi:predicted transcriptional regulator